MSTLSAIYPNLAPRTNTIAGVPVREDLLFTNHKGEEKAGLRKDAEKALEKLQGVLPRLLEPQETVLYIAQAVAPLSIFEQLTLGWYALQLKGVLLVLTNRRLLRFRRIPKGIRDWEWGRGVQSLRWSDVAEAAAKGWLVKVLTLKYRSGRKETYRILTIAAGKTIGKLVPALVPGGAAGAPSGQDMVCLCPECLQSLTSRVYQCSRCGLPFKDEKTLLWRSFLVPGGAYFYAGWRPLGFLHSIPYVMFAFAFVALALIALHVLPAPPPDPGQQAMSAGDAGIVSGVFLLLLLLENLVAWGNARRLVQDFIPAR